MALKRKDPGRTFSPSRARKVLSRSGLGSCRSPRRGLSTSFHTPAKPNPLPKPGGRIGLPSKGTSANMKVVVRVRPLNQRETESNARIVVDVVDDKMVVFDPKREEESFFFHGAKQRGRDIMKKENKNSKFLFDRVFGMESTNEEVFEGSTKSIVASVLDGFNCSVFVYGATGAGKTYTMLGTQNNPGITFRTMVTLFDEIEKQRQDKDFEIGVSYLEVYNETVKDLLNPSSGLLHLREDSSGVVVAGLKMEKISDPQKMFDLLECGNKQRTQHPTDSNAESSRSHAVFQVFLKMTTKANRQTKIVKLSMIDLAGSERGAATGCVGVRFKEGSNINKSLLALGNCINALADGLKHIPYRDSKLTRILKDSLGGNCQTVMIANVSPSHVTFEDSHNTLRYATRAKSIKFQIKRNVLSVELHVNDYIKMVEDLQAENKRLKKELEEVKAQNENLVASSASAPEPLPPPPPSHLPPVVAAAVAAINSQVRVAVNTVTVAVNTSPLKAPMNSEDLLSLKREAEKLYVEKTKLHQRYLNMHSIDEVLRLRTKMKQRTINRIRAMSSTPSRTDKAQCKVDNSLGQFSGRLTSVQNCREDLGFKEEQINEQLSKVREKLTELGVFDEVNPFLTALEIKFQNEELSIRYQHQEKLVEYLINELETQDEVILKVSSVFRHYYHLVRGHGHMTPEMTEEHEAVMRCLEGIKSVKFGETMEFREEDDEGCPSSIVKTWGAAVPLTPARVQALKESSSERGFSFSLTSSPLGPEKPLQKYFPPMENKEKESLVQSPACSSSSYPLAPHTGDTASMLDSLVLLDSKVESLLNTSVSSTAVEIGNYNSKPTTDSEPVDGRPLNVTFEADSDLNGTFIKEGENKINLNETFEKIDVENAKLPTKTTDFCSRKVKELNSTFSLEDDDCNENRVEEKSASLAMEQEQLVNAQPACAQNSVSPIRKRVLSPSLASASSVHLRKQKTFSPTATSPNDKVPTNIPSPKLLPNTNVERFLSPRSSPSSASKIPSPNTAARKTESAQASSPECAVSIAASSRKATTLSSFPALSVPVAASYRKVGTTASFPIPSLPAASSSVKSIMHKKTFNGGIGEKRKALLNSNGFVKPPNPKMLSIHKKVGALNNRLMNTPSKVKLAWNKENRNTVPIPGSKTPSSDGKSVGNSKSTATKTLPPPDPPSALNDTFTKSLPPN